MPTVTPAVDDDLRKRRKAAAANCTRWLIPRRLRLAEQLSQLVDATDADQIDIYGSGGAVAELEQEVAALLGKPAAVFMPSGIMAQQAALRVHADRAGTKRVAVHGLSHFVIHELNALEEVHQLRVERMTHEPRQPRPDELAAIPGALATVSLELPLRDAGYLLPSWDELVVFAEACAERGVPLHLDGARLWESIPYLGRSLTEVAELASTVYVSFYKGLGGAGGAALAGPEDVIAEARRWQRRLGGNLSTLYPYAIGAREGLRTVLPLMGELHQRAVEVAAAVQVEGFRVLPDPPHCNSFRVYAPRPADEIELAAIQRMEKTGEALTFTWMPADVPGWSLVEFVGTPDALGWDVSEISKAFGELLRG